jgi:hypothetical protein
MTVKYAHESLILEGPQAYRVILRRRYQALVVHLDTDSVHGTRVADEYEALILNSSLLIFLSFS